MEYQKYQDITPEQNAEWEAKYGKRRVSDIEVKFIDDIEPIDPDIADYEKVKAKAEAKAEANAIVYRFVVRKPDRSVLSAIGKHAQQNNVEKVNEVLIKNCVLGGDMEALEKDGEVYLEVLESINLLKSKAKSTIKKR
ncbi:hypothetical protein ACSTS3_19675 [Aquimarina muelleri]|uniref:hypothetical protein n=1 Tax=Aquimarina muelleri TaxID=279356 RepID=UPI003F683BF1